MSEPNFGPAMEPDIVQQPCIEIETEYGIEYVPLWVLCNPHTNMMASDWGIMLKELRYDDAFDLLSDYIDGRTRWGQPELHVDSWMARLHMPGYIDSTDWTLHESEESALAYLVDNYAQEEE